jgi:hypothetical protein
MTLEESLDALRKAAGASDHAVRPPAPPSNLPVPRSKQVSYTDIFSSGLQKFKERMGKILTGR